MNSRFDLIKYFGQLGFRLGAEIGVATGAFSEAMFQAIPNLKLYCIDIWHPYHGNIWSGSSRRGPEQFEIATKRLSKYNATLIREMSMEAVKRFEDGALDFVYIDANHAFDYIVQDLIEWSKKVRLNGIVSGDDYYHFRKAGVVEAVDAYTNAHGIKLNLTSPDLSREQPNYWWIKT